MEDGRARIAHTEIRLAGTADGRGILGAGLDGGPCVIDDIPFLADIDGGRGLRSSSHPNRVVEIDHLVAMSPNMDRTTTALGEAGIEHRRTRTFEAGGRRRRQAFFWMGDVILELVGDDDAHGEGPAQLWGLALTCDDLAAAAEALGDRLGSIKPAVQKGREIATLRTKKLGISVPVALLSPHPGSST